MISPVSPFQSARFSNGAMPFVLPPPLPFFSTTTTTGFPIAGVRRVSWRRRVEVAGGVRFDGPVVLTSDVEDNAVFFENCVTQTLPPALTLEEGLQKIKNAVQMLKAAPPRCPTGFLRFQVAVPPSPKALSWFCCQPESSGVFPLIFLSKNMDNPSCKSLHVNGSRGVFGIGTAVSFTHSSLGKQSLIKSIFNLMSLDVMPLFTHIDNITTNFNLMLSNVFYALDKKRSKYYHHSGHRFLLSMDVTFHKDESFFSNPQL